jgi:hypothetical protein
MKCLGRRVGAESDVLIKQAINSKRLTSNNIHGACAQRLGFAWASWQ